MTNTVGNKHRSNQYRCLGGFPDQIRSVWVCWVLGSVTIPSAECVPSMMTRKAKYSISSCAFGNLILHAPLPPPFFFNDAVRIVRIACVFSFVHYVLSIVLRALSFFCVFCGVSSFFCVFFFGVCCRWVVAALLLLWPSSFPL